MNDDSRAEADNDAALSADERESWLAEQIRLVTLEEGLI
jgi:hypothetical protein